MSIRQCFADGQVVVCGVSQLPMRTRLPEYSLANLASRAAYEAVADAGLEARDIDATILGLAPSALAGVDRPEYWLAGGLPTPASFRGRVHTAAASGLSALRLAAAMVAAGRADRVLVVAADLADETPVLARAVWQLLDPVTERCLPVNGITMAAIQANAYLARTGCSESDLALVAVKNRLNGCRNPFAQLRKPVTTEEVMASKPLARPIKMLDGSPRTSGGAAMVVSRRNANPASSILITIRGLASCASNYAMGARLVPSDMSYVDGRDLRRAAKRAYVMAGIGDPAAELDLAELYASFGVIELISVEALGLAGDTDAVALLREGSLDHDGAMPINPSGGATCGNPISATGLIRAVEAVQQLRGMAGERQVPDVRSSVVAAVGGAFQLQEVAVLSS